MLLGTLAVSLGATVPVAEAMIALSLVAVGGTLAAGRFASKTTAVWLFAGFGLFHGAAFGGSIAGQEGSVGLPVLLGYLIGLGAVQWLIARGAGALAQRASAMQVQLGGAMAAGVGVFLCLEMIEGVILG